MYRWVDHTAEAELHIEAASPEEVFADALAGLAELLAREEEASEGEPAVHEVELESVDPPTLLADWLAELVYLAETDGFVPERVASLELGATRLTATVEGRRARPSPLVKAVTYHGLELEQQGEHWRARVVLDV